MNLLSVLDQRCRRCRRGVGPVCDRCVPELPSPGPLRPVPGAEGLVVRWSYEGTVRDVVVDAKYRGRRADIAWLGGLLAEALPVGWPVEIVCGVPSSRDRRRAGGVDLGVPLAAAVARGIGVPMRRLLARRAGPPQTGRSRAARRRVPPRFRARPALPDLPGHRPVVLVVDDVVTTGTTLAVAAGGLLEAGAAGVYCAAVASTP